MPFCTMNTPRGSRWGQIEAQYRSPKDFCLHRKRDTGIIFIPNLMLIPAVVQIVST